MGVGCLTTLGEVFEEVSTVPTPKPAGLPLVIRQVGLVGVCVRRTQRNEVCLGQLAGVPRSAMGTNGCVRTYIDVDAKGDCVFNAGLDVGKW